MPAKKRFSAMQFSLKRLRDEGYTCCIVEQSVSFPDKTARPCPVCKATKSVPIQAGRLEHCGRNRTEARRNGHTLRPDHDCI
jgi:hypothetical protein